MLILKPGHQTPWIDLNEAMAQARASTIAENQLVVDRRKAAKAPQSEETNYPAIHALLTSAATAANNGQDSEIVEHLTQVQDHLGSRVVVPEPWADQEHLDGIKVRFKSLARATYADTRAQAMGALLRGDWGPAKELLASAVEVDEAAFTGDHGLSGLELWAEAEILSELLTVVLHFQGLSHEEKKLYGSPAA